VTRGERALLVGAVAMMAAALVDHVVRGSWVTLGVAAVVALAFVAAPRLLLTLASAAKHRVRAQAWAHEEGSHHSFCGTTLRIEHDARYSWVAGDDLQRVLGSRDREDVLAARLAGHWQRDPRGVLMLRVDAVVEHLAHMPGRMDPRVVRLRRYLEREVLYPAARRRARR
jgi:hypothetical protein